MIELHAHTTASDGTLEPAALVAYAATCEIRTLAVTDHDTLGGCEAAIRSGSDVGVRVVPGIELSVLYPTGTFHLLGYLPDTTPAPLMARMDEIASARDRRNRTIVDRLHDLGAAIEWEEVAARTTGRIGRPHIADALVAAGYATDRIDAFDRYLGDGAPAFLAAGSIPPAEAIALVKACGGVTAIAHPATLGHDLATLDRVVGELAAAGLDGLEAHRGDAPPEEQATYRALAERHGLIPTGGSDFHGPATEGSGRILGETGAPGARVDDLERLLARIG